MKENKDLANGDNKKEGGGYEAEFEKYLSGELEIEQLRSIESDIKKFRVLLNYMDQELDQELYERDTEAGGGEEEAGTEEAEPGRQISKAVSRKFRKYMIAAVVAAICIVPAVLAGLSPLLDFIYYDPDQSMEIMDEENESVIVVNPFVTNMSVYMELFCGDKGFANICLWPEGYGRYTIDVRTQIDGEETPHLLELVRNHLYRNDMNWNRSDFPDNAFTGRSMGISCSMPAEDAKKKLEKAPELMKIRAAVSFDGLKSMEELVDFIERHDTNYLYCPIEAEGYSYWGFAPVRSGYAYYYDREEFPFLDLNEYEGMEEEVTKARAYEEHVESMIRYLMEQEDFLKIFDGGVPGGKNYLDTYKYKGVLDYIREHGVKSYGVVVYARKEELLEILEDPSVEGVYMLDGKMDLKF